MPDYRRVWHPGGTYFFTVTLLQRRNNDLLTREIDLLRAVVIDVRRRHPFRIHAWVVVPDHLHCVIELPEGDVDFSVRWRLIKMGFSKGMPATERRSAVRQRRGEAHMDYVRFNPAKHGLVTRVVNWPYSTFHRLVEQGVYSADWGGSVESEKLVYDD